MAVAFQPLDPNIKDQYNEALRLTQENAQVAAILVLAQQILNVEVAIQAASTARAGHTETAATPSGA